MQTRQRICWTGPVRKFRTCLHLTQVQISIYLHLLKLMFGVDRETTLFRFQQCSAVLNSLKPGRRYLNGHKTESTNALAFQTKRLCRQEENRHQKISQEPTLVSIDLVRAACTSITVNTNIYNTFGDTTSLLGIFLLQ